MSEEKNTIEDLSYRQASNELETIVRELEAGDLELEESLDKYTRGLELIKSLRARLENAEQKVEELSSSVISEDK